MEPTATDEKANFVFNSCIKINSFCFVQNDIHIRRVEEVIITCTPGAYKHRRIFAKSSTLLCNCDTDEEGVYVEEISIKPKFAYLEKDRFVGTPANIIDCSPIPFWTIA